MKENPLWDEKPSLLSVVHSLPSPPPPTSNETASATPTPFQTAYRSPGLYQWISLVDVDVDVSAMNLLLFTYTSDPVSKNKDPKSLVSRHPYISSPPNPERENSDTK